MYDTVRNTVIFLITFSIVYGLWEADKLFTLRFNDILIIPRMAKISRQVFRLCKLWWTSDRAQRAAASNEDKEVQGKLKVEMRLRYYANLEQRIAFIWGSLCIDWRDSTENQHRIVPLRSYYEIRVSLDKDQRIIKRQLAINC